MTRGSPHTRTHEPVALQAAASGFTEGTNSHAEAHATAILAPTQPALRVTLGAPLTHSLTPCQSDLAAQPRRLAQTRWVVPSPASQILHSPPIRWESLLGRRAQLFQCSCDAGIQAASCAWLHAWRGVALYIRHQTAVGSHIMVRGEVLGHGQLEPCPIVSCTGSTTSCEIAECACRPAPAEPRQTQVVAKRL